MKTVCGLYNKFSIYIRAVENHSLNLIGPGQGQRPPVFLFHIILIFSFEIKKNILHINCI